jgi:hypothetical protein
MAIPQEMVDVLVRLDTETNEIAVVVRECRAKIKASMSQEDVDAVTRTLGTVADRLDATAKDPDQPVPPGSVPTL